MAKKKSLISIRIDPDMLNWYKAQGSSYQLLMQDVLHHHMIKTKHPLPGETPMPKSSLDGTAADRKKAVKPPLCKTCKGKDVIELDGLQVSCPECKPPLARFFEGDQQALKTVSDAAIGEIRLEEIDCPLYDTQVQAGVLSMPMTRREEYLTRPSEVAFFQNPNGRSLAFTNMSLGGQLSGPKRFYVSGLRIGISHIVDISEASLVLRIGEKPYLSVALANMERDDDYNLDLKTCPVLPRMRFRHKIEVPAYIPPAQNFGVTLSTGSKSFESAEIRVQLDGRLQRELQ